MGGAKKRKKKRSVIYKYLR